MNSKNEYKKLRIKYFIQQKIFELILFFIAGVAIIFVPFFVGKFILINFVTYDPYEFHEIITLIWLMGFLVCILGGTILWVLGSIVIGWIENNWEKAGERAKEKLKLNKSGGKNEKNKS